MNTSYLHTAVQSRETCPGSSSPASIAWGCPSFATTPDDRETREARRDKRIELADKEADRKAIERAENEGLPELPNPKSRRASSGGIMSSAILGPYRYETTKNTELMIGKLTARNLAFCLIFHCALLVGVAEPSDARADTLEMPANASATSYGTGWVCDRGFRENGGVCTALVVPDNGYLTHSSFGSGWECGRGYKKADETCQAVVLPSNAYLSASSGYAWKCERGYRQVNEECVEIAVPVNGYLTESTYGAGWSCDRGYRAMDGECLAIKVPANGYMTDSGVDSGWKCDRGYRAVDGACIAIGIPVHGYLSVSTFGSGWACDRGYRAAKEACVVVEMPENAHLDFSGNDWDCNRPYQKERGNCVPRQQNE